MGTTRSGYQLQDEFDERKARIEKRIEKMLGDIRAEESRRQGRCLPTSRGYQLVDLCDQRPVIHRKRDRDWDRLFVIVLALASLVIWLWM